MALGYFSTCASCFSFLSLLETYHLYWFFYFRKLNHPFWNPKFHDFSLASLLLETLLSIFFRSAKYSSHHKYLFSLLTKIRLDRQFFIVRTFEISGTNFEVAGKKCLFSDYASRITVKFNRFITTTPALPIFKSFLPCEKFHHHIMLISCSNFVLPLSSNKVFHHFASVPEKITSVKSAPLHETFHYLIFDSKIQAIFRKYLRKSIELNSTWWKIIQIELTMPTLSLICTISGAIITATFMGILISIGGIDAERHVALGGWTLPLLTLSRTLVCLLSLTPLHSIPL